MKKCMLVAFASLITAFTANAQEASSSPINNRVTLGIDAGVALPSGDFMAAEASPFNASSNNRVDGYAKSGYSFDAFLGVRLMGHLGVMAQIGSNTNPYNASGLNNSMGTGSANGDYHMYQYLIGPYLNWSFSKFNFEAKFLAGMISANYPTTTFTYNGVLNTYGSSIESSYKTGNGFGYCAGAKLSYMLIGHTIGIGIGLNYINTTINYNGVNTYSDQPNQPSSYTTKMGVTILEPFASASLNF